MPKVIAARRSHCAGGTSRKRNIMSRHDILETLVQSRFERRGDIGIIWIDNPPVNAISVGVRTAMIEGIGSLAADPEIKIGLLACEGRTFMAGADLTVFGKPPLLEELVAEGKGFANVRPRRQSAEPKAS